MLVQNQGLNPGIGIFQSRNPGIRKEVRDCSLYLLPITILNCYFSLQPTNLLQSLNYLTDMILNIVDILQASIALTSLQLSCLDNIRQTISLQVFNFSAKLLDEKIAFQSKGGAPAQTPNSASIHLLETASACDKTMLLLVL